MNAEQFAYWLQGYAELSPSPPSPEQWQAIRDHLATVFKKVTPTFTLPTTLPMSPPLPDLSKWVLPVSPDLHSAAADGHDRNMLKEPAMTPEEVERIASALTNAQREAVYLITKGGAYFRPNAEGYTRNRDEAGRYTLEEAIKHSHPNGPDGPRDGIRYEEAPAPLMPNYENLVKGLEALSAWLIANDIDMKLPDDCDADPADAAQAIKDLTALVREAMACLELYTHDAECGLCECPVSSGCAARFTLTKLKEATNG